MAFLAWFRGPPRPAVGLGRRGRGAGAWPGRRPARALSQQLRHRRASWAGLPGHGDLRGGCAAVAHGPHRPRPLDLAEVGRCRSTRPDSTSSSRGSSATSGRRAARLTVVIGDKLGLYRALAGPGRPRPSSRERTGTDDAVRPGVADRPGRQRVPRLRPRRPARFSLSQEQAAVLADETSPAFLVGAIQCRVDRQGRGEDPRRVPHRRGRGWDEHHHDLFVGTERLFRPGYVANLVTQWIPALDGVEAKLQAGGRSPTSAAGTAPRRSSWPRRTRASTLRGLRLPPPLDRARPQAGRRGRRRRSRRASRSPPPRTSRARLRPGVHLRRPARHGRPGRRGPPSAQRWPRTAPGCSSSRWPVTLEDNLNPVGRIFYWRRR